MRPAESRSLSLLHCELDARQVGFHFSLIAVMEHTRYWYLLEGGGMTTVGWLPDEACEN